MFSPAITSAYDRNSECLAVPQRTHQAGHAEACAPPRNLASRPSLQFAAAAGEASARCAFRSGSGDPRRARRSKEITQSHLGAGMKVPFGLFEKGWPAYIAGVTLHQHWQHLGQAKPHILEVITCSALWLSASHTPICNKGELLNTQTASRYPSRLSHQFRRRSSLSCFPYSSSCLFRNRPLPLKGRC
jgi:hypothetical protein